MGKSKQGILTSDSAFPFKKRTVWISYRSFEAISSNLFDENGSTTFAAGEYLAAVASGAGVAFPVQAHDLDMFGLSIAASGDSCHCLWMYPDDMDLDDPQLEFAVCFIHESTDADTPIWQVHHLDLAKQQEMKEAVNDVTEAITFDAHTCSTTDESFEVTSWAPAATNPAETDIGSLLAVKCSTISAGADEMKFFQLGIRYKANMLYDSGPAD